MRSAVRAGEMQRRYRERFRAGQVVAPTQRTRAMCWCSLPPSMWRAVMKMTGIGPPKMRTNGVPDDVILAALQARRCGMLWSLRLPQAMPERGFGQASPTLDESEPPCHGCADAGGVLVNFTPRNQSEAGE